MKTLIKVLIVVSLVLVYLLFQLVKTNKLKVEAMETKKHEIEMKIKQDSLKQIQRKRKEKENQEVFVKDIGNILRALENK